MSTLTMDRAKVLGERGMRVLDALARAGEPVPECTVWQLGGFPRGRTLYRELDELMRAGLVDFAGRVEGMNRYALSERGRELHDLEEFVMTASYVDVEGDEGR